MNPITREEFIKRWNVKCHKCFGVGHEGLPDILFIDDYWYEGMDDDSALASLGDMTAEMMSEMGHSGFC